MFNIQKYYFLPTEFNYVFCTDLRKSSDYFPIQHQHMFSTRLVKFKPHQSQICYVVILTLFDSTRFGFVYI